MVVSRVGGFSNPTLSERRSLSRRPWDLESEVVDADPPELRGRPRGMGKQPTRAPSRSAGVMGMARRKGVSGNRGRPVLNEGSGLNGAFRASVRAGVGQGHSTADAG